VRDDRAWTHLLRYLKNAAVIELPSVKLNNRRYNLSLLAPTSNDVTVSASHSTQNESFKEVFLSQSVGCYFEVKLNDGRVVVNIQNVDDDSGML